MSCLYKILGVTKTASKPEIKQAYRKLAFQFHPDKHTTSPPQTRATALEKFKQITNAYEILVDDRTRAAYDLRRPNESESRQHKRQEHHNAAQSRQSYNRRGGGQAESPNAAQTRQTKHLKLRAAAALQYLRHVCVEFFKFTVQVIVRAIIEAIVRLMLELILEMIVTILKALFQPSSTKKSKDEKKKK